MGKTLPHQPDALLNTEDNELYPSMINFKDKKAHPIAAKIPALVWEKVFHGQCYTRYLDLKGNFSDLKREDLPKNDEQALTVLILNYPDINPKIFQLDFKLVPVTNAFLELAPIRIDVYQWLQEQYPHYVSFDARRFFECIFHAIESGSISDFEWIKAQVGQETFEKGMKDYNIHFLGTLLADCARNKRLDVLQWFYNQLPETVFTDIVTLPYTDEDIPAAYGYLPILDWLHSTVPSVLTTLLDDLCQRCRVAPLRVIDVDTLNALNWFKDNKPEYFKQIIPLVFDAGDIETFKAIPPENLLLMMSSGGLRNRLEWLQANHLDAFNEFFEKNADTLFLQASFTGDQVALQYLKNQMPNKLKAWFKSEHRYMPDTQKKLLNELKWLKEEYPLRELEAIVYQYVYYATTMGFLDVLEWMKDNVPYLFNESQINFRLSRPEFSRALETACYGGYLDVLKWHFKQFPTNFVSTLKGIYPHLKDLYPRLFKEANLDTLIWLKDNAPYPFEKMMEGSQFSACVKAASRNNLEALQWFKDNLSVTCFKSMLFENNFAIFQAACLEGNLEIVKWILAQDQNASRMMLYLGDRYLSDACAQGHLHMVSWLQEQIPETIENTLNDYRKITHIFIRFFETNQQTLRNSSPYSISSQNKRKIASWLLSKPLVLSYAGQDPRYGFLVNPFVEEMLETLHDESAKLTARNTHAIFNISDERAVIYLHIASNIIRRNLPSLNGELRFLLEIPAIKAWAHRNIISEDEYAPPNTLLRLAMHVGNQQASEILLNIESVRLLAAENNYYINERTNGVDLHELAHDRESSMTALTEGETLRFKKIISHYKPQMQQLLASNIMAMLREDLLRHYQDDPASIMINEKRLNLPPDYDAFLALRLSDADTEAACKAYYAHTTHTALRYISKPNRWMHPNAAYVNINEDRTERWSTFEDYRNIICLFYLAAMDEDKPPLNMMITRGDKKPVDENTAVELRLQLFFKELALIGRAHNWDRERIRDGRREEYDDLEADRPSCFSGVKRRLFQSVQDHPLLIIIEQEHMEYELRQFAFEHFKSVLSGLDAKEVKRVFDTFCANVDEDKIAEIPSLKILDYFNIPEDKQATLIHNLSEKYGADFNHFKGWIQKKLALDPTSIWTRFHLMSLYSMTDFYEYLEKVVSCSSANSPGVTTGSSDVPLPLDPVVTRREFGDREKIAQINGQLAILQLKATELANAGYTEAQSEAKKIHKKLTKLVIDYESGSINAIELKEKAGPILEKRHELEQFRGWKLKKVGEVLANLAILIFSLGISYAVTQQFTLFKVKTDSHEKIEALSNVINTDPKLQ